jgi:hypothetical protein
MNIPVNLGRILRQPFIANPGGHSAFASKKVKPTNCALLCFFETGKPCYFVIKYPSMIQQKLKSFILKIRGKKKKIIVNDSNYAVYVALLSQQLLS